MPGSCAARIVEAALRQAQERALYTPGYFRLDYPGGDLSRDQGVCTDVIVRSLRGAGYDLQVLVHEDMKKRFAEYPAKWGLKRPDRNIDHRRVPNLMCFFARHGISLSKEIPAEGFGSWRGGDLVFWKFPNGLDHCGVLSNEVAPSGRLMAVHNGDVCRLEDCLDFWTITGHFRFPVDKEGKE